MDCICRGSFDKEGEKGKDAVDKVDDESADDDKEYCKPAAHGG